MASPSPQKKAKTSERPPTPKQWVNKHWDQFYAIAQIPQECSSFAHTIEPILSKTEPLIEVGCGNGRDSFYFADRGFTVFAVDLSEVAISTDRKDAMAAHKKQTKSKLLNPQFEVSDITNLPEEGFKDVAQFGTVYSRFTLHAISAEGEKRLVNWAYRHLCPGGVLVAEARSVKGDLYGKGTPVPGDPDAFVYGGGGAGEYGHFRRFLRDTVVKAELAEAGFVLESLEERSGVAVYRDDDPVVLRFVARKPIVKAK